MPTITFNQAKKFLNEITRKNHVAIITDADADGFTAGILFSNFLKNKEINHSNFIFTRNKSSFKNYNLKKFDTIIIADLAPSTIQEDLQLIKHKKTFYTDHHPPIQTPTQQLTTNEKRKATSEIADHHPDTQLTTHDSGHTTLKSKTFQEYRTKSEISSAKTTYNLTGGNKFMEAVANSTDAGSFQKENRKIIDKFLKKNKITFEQFNRQVGYKIVRTIDYFHKNPAKAFKILQSINSLKDLNKLNKYDRVIGKEIKKHVKQYNTKKQKIGKINFFYFKPKYPIKSSIINEISYTHPKQTYIFATPMINNKKTITLSARNQTKKIDMAQLLNKAISNLKNASAGGHIPAAGGAIQSKDLTQFKQNLKTESLLSKPQNSTTKTKSLKSQK